MLCECLLMSYWILIFVWNGKFKSKVEYPCTKIVCGWCCDNVKRDSIWLQLASEWADWINEKANQFEGKHIICKSCRSDTISMEAQSNWPEHRYVIKNWTVFSRNIWWNEMTNLDLENVNHWGSEVAWNSGICIFHSLNSCRNALNSVVLSTLIFSAIPIFD